VTRQLQFGIDSASLTDPDKAALDEMAVNLIRLKFMAGTVEVHTDNTGSDAYNQGLSERRAENRRVVLKRTDCDAPR
jgi:OOP family OmpA-OmpF porin